MPTETKLTFISTVTPTLLTLRFSNGSVDRNDVAIDIWGDGNYVETIVNTDVGGGDRNDIRYPSSNSNDNRIFTLQTGSYSNATVDLSNSNMNQLWFVQTSYDNAVVLGNGANGNVGLICKTNMRLHTFIKTALVARFISYHLNGFFFRFKSSAVPDKNNNLMLTVNNSMYLHLR
ncbi:hypothetical protein O9929_04395 [Vibrio lentus]|nr:hypothetical protein [Vibrio lentus]